MDSIKIKGTYKFEIMGVDGNVRKQWTVNNLVVTVGKAQLALLAGDATATPFTYLALGTSSTAVSAGQTALAAEITDTGLQRVSATVSRTTTSTTNDTLSLVKVFTATGSKTVEEVGVFNASSSGTMLSRALTTSTVMSNAETLTVTYLLQFS